MKTKQQMLEEVSEMYGGVTTNLTDGQVTSLVNLLSKEINEMKQHLPKIEEMGIGFSQQFKDNIEFYTELKNSFNKSLNEYYENY